MVDGLASKIEYLTNAIKGTYGEIARMELMRRADLQLLEALPDNGEKEKVQKESQARIEKYDRDIEEAEKSILNIEGLLREYQKEAKK